MFSFNFDLNEKASDCCMFNPNDAATMSTVNVQENVDAGVIMTGELRPAKMHSIVPVGVDNFPKVGVNLGKMGIIQVVNTEAKEVVKKTGELQTLLQNSDLENGVYEGGFKVWECSIDLAKFLQENVHLVPISQYKTVMELGCGHGLPGIYTLLNGAERVIFTDYNAEVLDLTTCPNVYNNVPPNLLAKAEFYSGDWESVSLYMNKHFLNLNKSCTMDLILTAETIYTEEVACKLYAMIKRHLHPQHGIAFVAAKKYYFGTGGSVQHFMALVHADGLFQAKVVWSEQNCHSNIREIVMLTCQ